MFIVAVANNHLLNLLLAYSASHRARLLQHEEPSRRISMFINEAVMTLGKSLTNGDEKERLTNANLATAIMLSSLEIISPSSFEIKVPWQVHLRYARDILEARGGAKNVHRTDREIYFLTRWFAYLDVLGNFSGQRMDDTSDTPSFGGSYWVSDSIDDENEFEIDCLLGFTSRCVNILAEIADLARICDVQRRRSILAGEEWAPTSDIVEQAQKLQGSLEAARTHVPSIKGCVHNHSSPDSHGAVFSTLEMQATNEAFHWAGLVHLHRRVLGKPSEHPDVQEGVGEIIGALNKVEKGGSAEACLLFPMFTAGCDARDERQRRFVGERIRSIEQVGLTQVKKARDLMERSWSTGQPWELLGQGEFIG
jgi:Fungal specific transcription factor domain